MFARIDCVDTLYVTYIENTFEGDLLIANMSRRNDYSEENIFHCSYGYCESILETSVTLNCEK